MKKILAFVLLLVPMSVNAIEDTFGLNKLYGTTDLNIKQQSLTETISRLINVILGFLGVFATVVIIYGGFLHMTSYGDSSKIEKSHDIIKAGVIGLLIILASVAIANFVVGNLTKATGN